MAATSSFRDTKQLQAMIDSFGISLLGAKKKPKTIEIYIEATERFAVHLLTHRPDASWFDPVQRRDVELYIAWLSDHEYAPGKRYSGSYINQNYRSIQQFFKWLGEEEDLPSPLTKLLPPQTDEKIVPILAPGDMARLIKEAERSRDFADRRDAAILRMFASSGGRLSEISKLRLDQVNLAGREALVTGKKERQRTIKFDQKTTQALDRYLRVRGSNKFKDSPMLWLGKVGPLLPKSIYRMISRRGADLGIKIYPHMFRHTFSHNWLDKGGAEGDLMELNGWVSGEMLRRYGASARSARAQRAYDRIDVMDGI